MLTNIVLATILWLICYLIIVLTSPRLIVLYFFKSDIFNALKIAMIFDAKKKSFTYILTILISSSEYCSDKNAKIFIKLYKSDILEEYYNILVSKSSRLS